MTVEKTKTGFSAFYKTVFTTGKDLIELRKMAVEALSLYFEDDNIEIKPNDIIFKRYDGTKR